MLVIIHGWSDNAKSFNKLARYLGRPRPEGIGAEISHIHLGDYVSMDDQVTFNDLVDAMHRAWLDRGLSTVPRSVDAVVHSTGGLIIRDWICTRFKPGESPIKRLLMLAPANFGSPLAHMGRSFYGRAIKGWSGVRLFETGGEVLRGLELASPYSWELAERDLFCNQPYYGTGRILCTVLVGNTGYDGISSIANKPGSDGTVRISTANLNAEMFALNFSENPNEPIVPTKQSVQDQVAFAIADGEDHSTIAAKDGGPRRKETWDLICGALTVEDDDFDEWRSRLGQHTGIVTKIAEARSRDYYDSYQNTVVRVVDNHGAPVDDYVVEFYVNDDKKAGDRRATRRLQETVMRSVHAYSDDESYRSFLINCTELYKLISDDRDHLNISVTAYPDIGRGNVGYRTYTDQDIGSLSIDRRQVRRLFVPHRTVLITLCIHRYQKESLFRFKDAGE